MQSRGVKGFADIVRGLFGYYVAGPVDYLALYPGKVVAQSADKTRCDVQLDSERMPSPSNVPLRVGLPGTVTTLDLSSPVRVLVGWECGDPSKPYAHLWESSSPTPTVLTIRGTTVHIGSDTGSNFVALANLVDAELTKVATAHNTHVHIASGNTTAVGAPVATTIATPLIQYTRAGVGATQVKAK